MLERGRGHIVNVSSLSGVAPFPGLAAYSSTKAGSRSSPPDCGPTCAATPSEPRWSSSDRCPPTCSPTPAPTGRPGTRSPAYDGSSSCLIPARDRAAKAVVDAVEGGRRHVRLPRRAAGFAMMTESPRRLTEWALTGVKHQARERRADLDQDLARRTYESRSPVTPRRGCHLAACARQYGCAVMVAPRRPPVAPAKRSGVQRLVLAVGVFVSTCLLADGLRRRAGAIGSSATSIG